MSEPYFAVVGIGNAIVDVDVSVDETFLHAQELPKGQMTLVDSQRMTELSKLLNDKNKYRKSGGSAANTIFAATGFGLNTGYACRLANDVNGNFFFNVTIWVHSRSAGKDFMWRHNL